ncbi:MAG: fasciclin domain-containing protein [Planctomycetota bacterium]
MIKRMKKKNARYEQLEKRQLLAGDVSAVLAGNSLVISGDSSGNEVLIATNADGEIEVSGENGTTINGGENLVADIGDAVLQDLLIFMRGGADSVAIENVSIAGRTVVRGGSGSDAIGILNTDVGTDLRIDSGAQGDFISLDNVEIEGNLVVRSRGGEDTIGIDASDIDGRTIVDSGSLSDRVAIRDSSHQSAVRISTAGGSDFVSADGLDISSSVRIVTGGRADNLFVNDSRFGSSVLAKGNGGSDVLEVTGNTTFAQTPRTFSFEGNDVPGGIPQTEAVFTDLIAADARLGTIVEIAAMTPELTQLVGALQATGLDSALAGDGPLTVFAPLNSAFDAISEVVAGLNNDQLSDVLLFHVTSGSVFAEELVTLDSVATLLGQSFDVDVTNGVVLNGSVTLAATDIRAKNGVIHLLNDVLVPVL